MKSHLKLVSALLFSSLTLGLLAQAPVATPRTTTTATHELARKDKKFLMKAAKSGHKEVAVSEAAASKLTAPGAKEYAMMMVTAHTAVNGELAALAARKGVTLPAEDADIREKWMKKKAKGLDEEYLEEMVDDHERAVSLFEKGAKSNDPDIAAFAAKTLPSLRQHLMEAERLEDQID